MLEKCSHSMRHWEHMCSLTHSGCESMEKSGYSADYECIPCGEGHRHYSGCTSSYVAT